MKKTQSREQTSVMVGGRAEVRGRPYLIGDGLGPSGSQHSQKPISPLCRPFRLPCIGHDKWGGERSPWQGGGRGQLGPFLRAGDPWRFVTGAVIVARRRAGRSRLAGGHSPVNVALQRLAVTSWNSGATAVDTIGFSSPRPCNAPKWAKSQDAVSLLCVRGDSAFTDRKTTQCLKQ